GRQPDDHHDRATDGRQSWPQGAPLRLLGGDGAHKPEDLADGQIPDPQRRRPDQELEVPERLCDEDEADEDAQDAEQDRAPRGLATPLDPYAGASPHHGRREFALDAGGGRRHDESVRGDPESGEAQVLRDLAQRTLDRARELRIVDLPPDEPGRDEQERDDEQAVDHRRDTEPANGAPPVLREEDGPDHGAQPEGQGGDGDLPDDSLRVPKAVVADRLRDVTQAVVEPARALLIPSPAARRLEAARDQRERGTEVESLPATSALLDDGLVRAANRVPEDRL